ncbi:hypothetical protein DESME_01860 [Desulfitobacterium metallireducens DSM 15288]|uniref:Uncharacterized protein n=1 Tax=Desulfitobacterium metallireducens DSM 15288 TaxID=871968 RepID=W0ECA5_9FIRM|nr:hypothetical protein DESME_01860 [Desulfitobacterium metallireducens DSM 15288]
MWGMGMGTGWGQPGWQHRWRRHVRWERRHWRRWHRW